MGKATSFLATEKVRQAGLKDDTTLFSLRACVDGPYSVPTAKHPHPPTYPFCLPVALAAENLYDEVRASQIQAFAVRGIPWHKGVNGGPTTHLCSSQVCCVNFLAPLATRPEALINLVRPLYPDSLEMLPVDPCAGDYVEFEWIGDPLVNYLDEGNKQGTRTRGANCTSADAAVRYRDTSGAEHVILIEWKYCESYRDLATIPPARRLLSSVDGTLTPAARTRRARYEERLDALVDLPDGLTFDDLCVEPLYQLMRQQLLAREMETVGREADSVSVLHLSPRANHDFTLITSPALRTWAKSQYQGEDLSVTEAWLRLQSGGARFQRAAIEDFFAPALASNAPALAGWRSYIAKRYAWAVD